MSYELIGGMPERLNGAVSKTAISEKVSGVRIPLPPPIFITLDKFFLCDRLFCCGDV